MNNILFKTKEDINIEKMFSRGDEQSFLLLYDKFSPLLLGVICRIEARVEVAEDILKQTFLSAWNNKSSFDNSKCNLLTWLTRIARQEAIGVSKYNVNKSKPVSDNVYVNTKNEIEQNKKTAVSSHRLNGVTGNYKNEFATGMNGTKTAFNLVYLQGMSLEEAANKLNTTTEQLKINIRAIIKEGLKSE